MFFEILAMLIDTYWPFLLAVLFIGMATGWVAANKS